MIARWFHDVFGASTICRPETNRRESPGAGIANTQSIVSSIVSVRRKTKDLGVLTGYLEFWRGRRKEGHAYEYWTHSPVTHNWSTHLRVSLSQQQIGMAGRSDMTLAADTDPGEMRTGLWFRFLGVKQCVGRQA